MSDPGTDGVGSGAAAGPTVGALAAEGERLLASSGVPAARLEAEVLLGRRLGLERASLLGRWEEPVPASSARAYREDLDRRASRYPLQYITGRQEFYSLEFEVDERVLIPRPETEMIVDAVLRLAPRTGSPLVVDVGTGSGCIAIALAVHLPSAVVAALDLSPDALAVARSNAARHGVLDRIRFLQGDGLEPAFEAGLAGRVDFLVSNPPYVAEAEMEGLQPELRYEPRIALTPGREGLAFTTRLLERAGRLLAPGGWLLVELSSGRAHQAVEGLREGDWDAVEVRPDIQEIPRLLVARRRKDLESEGP